MRDFGGRGDVKSCGSPALGSRLDASRGRLLVRAVPAALLVGDGQRGIETRVAQAINFAHGTSLIRSWRVLDRGGPDAAGESFTTAESLTASAFDRSFTKTVLLNSDGCTRHSSRFSAAAASAIATLDEPPGSADAPSGTTGCSPVFTVTGLPGATDSRTRIATGDSRCGPRRYRWIDVDELPKRLSRAAGIDPRLGEFVNTLAARAADNSQFDGKDAVLIGRSSVCPSTRMGFGTASGPRPACPAPEPPGPKSRPRRSGTGCRR